MHAQTPQLALALGQVMPSDEQLRAAHRDLGIGLSFEAAMADACFAILVKNYAWARLANPQKRAA